MVEPPFSSYLVWSVFPLTLSLTLFVVILSVCVAPPSPSRRVTPVSNS